MTRPVLVCGEALIDLTPATEPGAWRAHPGGSPFNVAVGLARLGCPVAFAGRLSCDVFGRQLRERLESDGVDTGPSVAAAEPTSLAVVDVGDDGVASYVFHMSGTADWQWTEAELPDPSGAAAVHTGSLALLRDPGAAAIEAWLRRCRGRSVVSIDPNVRPSVQPDGELYRADVERWVGLADVVKASSEDVAWLYPGTSLEDVGRRWLGLGPSLVVVTRGPEGAVAWGSAGWQREVPGRPVELVDTIGAGDAFSSGLLDALHRESALTPAGLRALDPTVAERVLRAAVLVASETCGRRGADPPRRAELPAS